MCEYPDVISVHDTNMTASDSW